MGKHNVSRVKIVPEKLFYKMWHSVPKFQTRDEYVHNFVSVFSSDYVDCHKLDLPPGTLLDVLLESWRCYHIDIPSIINMSGLTRASFGYRYCIPIRTLEEWCKKDTSPDYVRLMILKDLNEFHLPKYVHVQ